MTWYIEIEEEQPPETPPEERKWEKYIPFAFVGLAFLALLLSKKR